MSKNTWSHIAHILNLYTGITYGILVVPGTSYVCIMIINFIKEGKLFFLGTKTQDYRQERNLISCQTASIPVSVIQSFWSIFQMHVSL